MTTTNEAAERLLEWLRENNHSAAVQTPGKGPAYMDSYNPSYQPVADAMPGILAAERRVTEAETRRATVERIVALLDTMIDHPRNEPRYRAAFVGLKVARRAILDEEAAR